ncbi:MAG: UDP-glucose dehydrogenase family protein [Bacillota bacterium]
MRITVIGTGYVGLVTGVCLAEIGHEVTCVDHNEMKVENLNKGISPIYEAYLDDMLKRNVNERRLCFTTSVEDAVKTSYVIFIAVGTPSLTDGNVDMSQVEAVAQCIGKSMDGYRIIVNKSTVPVGTTRKVRKIIEENLQDKISFDVVSNPEFLREGTAVHDTFHGDRIVIGSESEKSANILKEIYKPLNLKTMVTDPESAELIKYASNAFLATKISFINEMANICELAGGDVREVAKGMGMDRRIGDKFLHAGIGFGGACFPKDVKGLIKIGENLGYDFKIIKQTLVVNQQQREKVIKILESRFKNLEEIHVAILGLAFKAGTDDIREAPALFIMEELLKRGAKVRAYDPIAMDNMRKELHDPVQYVSNPYQAVKDADALLILTEWRDFQELSIRKIRGLMKHRVMIDGRNIFDGKSMREKGFEYHGIGVCSKEILVPNYAQDICMTSHENTTEKRSAFNPLFHLQ